MLSSAALKELERIVGRAGLRSDAETLTSYSFDATRTERLPWAVVWPSDANQVSSVMRLANRERFPVVPRGAGSGMSGGSVPASGGVVLSLERMNRILEIDEQDMVAVVEPGVVTGDLQREVERRGLFYPPDPASHRFCTIGGNVAECAGGLRAVKYGVTRDYVLGMEVVLPTGEITETGARTVKSVAGYDLTRLIVGAEGTLGIVTRVLLRLVPLPESVVTMTASFRAVETAAAACSAVISGRILPRALEIMDRGSLRAVETYLKEDVSGGAEALVLVEVDGTSQSAAEEADRVKAVLSKAGAARVLVADGEAERERLWRARRAISPALYAIKPKKINEDIVVPRSRVAEALREISDIAARRGLLVVNFGHAGDGNIHTNIMIDEGEERNAEDAVQEVLAAVLRLGGSITGEHGIGMSKAAYLPLEVKPAALSAMRSIKKALDPNNVLNPGKIFL